MNAMSNPEEWLPFLKKYAAAACAKEWPGKQLVDFLQSRLSSKHEICRVVFSEFAAYFPSMSLSVEQIAEEALALPSEARVLLADRLVESLDSVEDEKIHRLWAAEALRRRDEVRSGRVKTIPGDEALARVRKAVAR